MSVFDENLKNRAVALKGEIELELGAAIQMILEKHGIKLTGYENLPLRVSNIHYDSGHYSKPKYKASFASKQDGGNVEPILEKKLVKDFQDSLDNFSWAVENMR